MENMLEVSNLTVKFEQLSSEKQGEDFIVVKDLDVKVSAGEFVCILGPSGCGKTTLLRVIVRLLRADNGIIKVAGSQTYALGKDVCMVFQNYGLFPWKIVRENVEFGLKVMNVPAKERREIGSKFIELVGLQGFENHYPHQISGGMQQRVGLARALACKPKLLLLDEPFAAVDSQTRERLQEETLRIVGETSTTCVFVTHSIEEAVYLGDRVLVMSKAPGIIVEDIPINLGTKRWTLPVRLEAIFEDYVREVRIAFINSTDGKAKNENH
jgi:NitT/TauT family transport system ATP-binding protein